MLIWGHNVGTYVSISKSLTHDSN